MTESKVIIAYNETEMKPLFVINDSASDHDKMDYVIKQLKELNDSYNYEAFRLYFKYKMYGKGCQAEILVKLKDNIPVKIIDVGDVYAYKIASVLNQEKTDDSIRYEILQLNGYNDKDY